jgi:putative spermidine/putrescine transport system permease protein
MDPPKAPPAPGLLFEDALRWATTPRFPARRTRRSRTRPLPLIAPGIAAGAFIAFMASFDNVALSLFLSDARSEVLPIRLWNLIESSLDVRAAAVSGVLIAGTVVLALVMERVVGLSRHVR